MASQDPTQLPGKIPADQLRNAALRSWHLKQVLTQPKRPIQHSVQLPGTSYHYTRGSRFLFHVGSEISCWDAWKGQKIESTKGLEEVQVGVNDWARRTLRAITSTCRSHAEIYLACSGKGSTGMVMGKKPCSWRL